ncbi:MAG: polyprenyl synthetase family protein [Anaerolineaceae bacterium]|nr:MAG: polyprenyl synthetase family protein [Anaerolineaceae bacterium]
MKFDALIQAVSNRQQQIKQYLSEERNRLQFKNTHLQEAVYSYVNAGGKSLRPAVLMFACGAVGGDEVQALPAAAAVELYHTFTLVHDDIIDRDEMRRGVPTVHTQFSARARQEMGYDAATAEHYGLAVAILAGDLQQGWAASLLPDLHTTYGLPPALALNLVSELFRRTQITLINGETTDILQAELPVEAVSEADVLNMLWEKTGILYQFAGRAGAAIGLREADLNHPTVQAVGEFTGKCGTAFQIQDDILGIVGDEKRVGKPIGSDIREGKRTIIVLNALPRMSEADRDFMLKTLGNDSASEADIKRATKLLDDAGGIQHARDLSRRYIAEAIGHLEVLPPSAHKDLLLLWADYITERDL